jgi:hypothetical protein
MKELIIWAFGSGWTIVLVVLIPYLMSLTPKYIEQPFSRYAPGIIFGSVFILFGTILTLVEII